MTVEQYLLCRIAGVAVAVAAIPLLLVSAFCVYINIACPREEPKPGMDVLWLNPGLQGLWLSVPALVVSLLALLLGLRLWALHRPGAPPDIGA